MIENGKKRVVRLRDAVSGIAKSLKISLSAGNDTISYIKTNVILTGGRYPFCCNAHFFPVRITLVLMYEMVPVLL